MTTGRTPGKAAPREERRFDNTYLTPDTHKVHRDYLAHAFRWGFAHRFCKGERVLDVGCGAEWPLGQVLQNHGNLGIRAEKYVGVDAGPKPKEKRTVLADLWPDFSFGERWQELVAAYGKFGVVCSFEVIEHCDLADGKLILAGIRGCVKDDGIVLLSTPVNDGHRQARNHIHEWGTEELAAALATAGLRVERSFGTFADVSRVRKAIKDAGRADHLQTWEDLREWFSDDVLSCFLAPLYPEVAKNRLHVCRPWKEEEE